MSETRLAEKVGLFVVLGLVLLAALLLNFSKGKTLLKKTYEVVLITPNVGNIQPGAAVLMAGMQVGHVARTALAHDGYSVTVRLAIFRQYLIRTNAQFSIEQAGFLGDQYVAVKPSTNQWARPLADGDTVWCVEPFNLQEAAQKATKALDAIIGVTDHVNQAVTNVNFILLNEQRLSNLATRIDVTTSNFTQVSSQAVATLGRLDHVVRESGPKVTNAVNNFSNVAATLHDFAQELRQDLRKMPVDRLTNDLLTFSATLTNFLLSATNRAAHMLSNLETASAQATNLLADVQAQLHTNRGPLSAVLHDEGMRDKMGDIMTNVAGLSFELSNASYRLNHEGLWRFLWRPKIAKAAATNKPGRAEPLVAPSRKP